jgi:uncharacterized flavoprotein (TIGR03862 family)
MQPQLKRETSEPSAPATAAIIGAGPAGLMAAEVLATAGCKVTVYDHMLSPARKFLMAGRGGLNLTHSEPLPEFLTRYGASASPLLVQAIEAFPPQAVVAWADGLGQETFVGSSGRIFPKAMKASPLLRAWLKRLDGLGVTFQLGQRWVGRSADGAPMFVTRDNTQHSAKSDVVVLALGGASWPRLGSDGQWAPIMRDAGLSVVDFAPSNVGVSVIWSDVMQRFAGQPLKRIAVSMLGSISHRGEAMVTATGLEGGAIYALSKDIRSALAAGAPVTLHIDLRPDDVDGQLKQALSRPRGKQSQSTFIRKAAVLTPAAMALLREAGRGVLPTSASELTALIKGVPIKITGTQGLSRAISSAGGLSFTAANHRFMVTSLPGTFVAGEMLDWDAPTGGYLLQASLATGVAAANGALAWLAETSSHGRVDQQGEEADSQS